jgi:hypothetical protein
MHEATAENKPSERHGASVEHFIYFFIFLLFKKTTLNVLKSGVQREHAWIKDRALLCSFLIILTLLLLFVASVSWRMAVGNLSGGEKQDGCCLYIVLAYTSGCCLDG